MKLVYHPRFKKELRNFSPDVRVQFYERGSLLLDDRSHPMIKCHALHGKYKGFLSINITGDVRAIFYITQDEYVFVRFGTHHQLYGN